MHELPWITIFGSRVRRSANGSRVRRSANNFHKWRSHEWKWLANRITSDAKIIIHGKECIILFLTRYLMSWTYNSTKNNHQSLISPLSLRTVFSDLTLWRDNTWSVTSHEVALWCHTCQLFLHVQIHANAIFTSEEQPWISISHHPVFMA